MKALLRRIFGKPFSRHPDSFALTRKVLWQSIADSIHLQQSLGKSVWLVAHFEETFLSCQEMLERNQIDYVVETQNLNKEWFDDPSNLTPSPVRLWLADLVLPLDKNKELSPSTHYPIAMMIAERHPFGPKDEVLIDVARAAPVKVELGYFMAMEDELVKRLIPPQLIELMKTMGLQDQDLISSSIITRRLEKLIRKGTATADIAQEAESAAHWFALQDGKASRRNE